MSEILAYYPNDPKTLTWYGMIHTRATDVPQIRHLCDLNGITYVQAGNTTMYLYRSNMLPRFATFAEFVECAKRFGQIKKADEGVL